jgi:hypothetical protein
VHSFIETELIGCRRIARRVIAKPVVKPFRKRLLT